jgi:mono/diheme cytochrome c family protein
MNFARILLAWILIAGWIVNPICAAAPDDRAGQEFFERRVRPLLLERCAECHGPDLQESGLRLDNSAAVRRGGDGGPIIVPGKPDQSRLIEAVGYVGKLQMPPDKKLPDADIAALSEWVSQGARWPVEAAPVSDSEPRLGDMAAIMAAAKDHWAFQPVGTFSPPAVKNVRWPRSPIDPFVLATLESRGLSANGPADRSVLIRRATYDLIGLPPTYEEVRAFVADDSPDAFARLVDRLLASPRYGERWGRHWLDVARYADTKGYVGVGAGDLQRREYPYAYAYRDWVIRAMNDDVPYDQFLIQQIAADLLPSGENESALAALGFFRVGRVFLSNERDQIDDKIDVLMRGTQGLTVACARCHDHKFDPLPTADYYSLFGIFKNTKNIDDQVHQRMLLADEKHPSTTRILRRGNPSTPGDDVPRRFLAILSPPDRKPFVNGSGRLELARAIANRENPLTARVMVNRVWAHHFGRGLVPTASDFGTRGERPSHPELLDFLAQQFMNDGWSLKKLHRAIMNSAVYQQSSRNRPECAAADPENRLLWRSNRRRLDFEQLRDSMLAVSGELDLTMHGPSVELTVAPFSSRRTVYGRVDRQNLPALFRTFDFANPDSHSPGRFETTVPQQGLFLLNHPFVLDRARGLIVRLNGEHLMDPQARVGRLYEMILSRDPGLEEMNAATEYVCEKPAADDAPHSVFGPWERLAQSLLLTNEFLFVD